MKTERIVLDVIDVSSRLRPLNEAAILAMMESMRQVGQLQPIAVHSPADGQVILVAGAHRIEAARRIGWNEIEAVFVDGTDIERELHEIAENLHRAELTALERSTHIARWAELTAAKVSQLATPAIGGDQPKEKGVRKVARDLGLDKDDVSRAVKIAALSDQAKQAARDAGLDNNRAALLLAVKESTPEEQVAKVEEIAADKNSKASQPRQRATSGKAVTAADVKAHKEEIRERDAKIKTLKFQKQEAERRGDESTQSADARKIEINLLSRDIEKLKEELDRIRQNCTCNGDLMSLPLSCVTDSTTVVKFIPPAQEEPAVEIDVVNTTPEAFWKGFPDPISRAKAVTWLLSYNAKIFAILAAEAAV